MIRLIITCLALAAAASGCGPSPQNAEESSSGEIAIRAATETWISAYEQGDVDTLANLYEEDAMYAANTGEVLAGRDGIRAGMSRWLAERPTGIELQLEAQPLRFVSRGTGAHNVLRFVVRDNPAGCSIQAGHALAVWHRQSDGNWVIATQLVNRDPQPPADACARETVITPDDERQGMNKLSSSAIAETVTPSEFDADQSFAVPAAAAAAITKIWEAWLDAFERGDSETLAGFFAEDGIYAANTGQVLRGRAGIREGVGGWVALLPMHLKGFGLRPDSPIDVEVNLLRFRTAGDAVYRLSRFMIMVEPSRCAMDSGHVLSLWRRQADSEWRIESLIGNRDAEPPDEACGLKRKDPQAQARMLR